MNKVGNATQASTVVATPPAVASKPDDGPNWAAVFALIISVITFVKTLYSDFRASRAKRLAKFETDYGTPIRTGLRAYEKTIKTLRVFSLASNKSADELKTEIEKYRTTWIDGAYEISRLLAEADSSGTLTDGGWSDCWTVKTDEAEALMIELTDPATATQLEIASLAKRALTELEVAIAESRRSLRDQAATY